MPGCCGSGCAGNGSSSSINSSRRERPALGVAAAGVEAATVDEGLEEADDKVTVRAGGTGAGAGEVSVWAVGKTAAEADEPRRRVGDDGVTFIAFLLLCGRKDASGLMEGDASLTAGAGRTRAGVEAECDSEEDEDDDDDGDGDDEADAAGSAAGDGMAPFAAGGRRAPTRGGEAGEGEGDREG